MNNLPDLRDREEWAKWLYENAPGYICDAVLGIVTSSTLELRHALNKQSEVRRDSGRNNKVKDSVVKAYMESVACEHVDLDTGELNCTTLAEDAAAHFDLYAGHSDDPQDWLFDLALDIAEAEEGGSD